MSEFSQLSSFWLWAWPLAVQEGFLIWERSNSLEKHAENAFGNHLNVLAFVCCKGFDLVDQLFRETDGPLHALLTFRGFHPQIMEFWGVYCYPENKENIVCFGNKR